MSTSKEYWKRREYQNLLKSKNRDERFVKERIAYIYNELLRNINKEIQSQITRFSDSQGISINEARKRIEKADVEDYKYLAKTYVKDKDFSQKANREIKLYNITMRLNRLEMLNQMVRLHIIGTGSKVENELKDHLIKGSIDEYKRQASILGLNINQTGIERRARFIVSQDYHNAHFSDRVWRDTRELSRRIERNIESVVIQGKNPREFARKLRDLVSKDIKNITNATERLAYTESGRVWIQTQIEAYKDGGYEYLEIMTEPTACRHCSPHNGDIVKISEAVEGDNIPLWHPRCRCTTVAHFKEENRGNSESSGYNDNVITYISGAITDTDSQEARKFAKIEYGSIRKRKVDIKRIANNIGYSERQIEEIKNYLFVDKHDLGNGEYKRFDPRFEIAQSWNRLMRGNAEKHDLTLIKHEIYEKQLISKGLSQDQAHIQASIKYNYQKEAKEYYDLLKKRKKRK